MNMITNTVKFHFQHLWLITTVLIGLFFLNILWFQTSFYIFHTLLSFEKKKFWIQFLKNWFSELTGSLRLLASNTLVVVSHPLILAAVMCLIRIEISKIFFFLNVVKGEFRCSRAGWVILLVWEYCAAAGFLVYLSPYFHLNTTNSLIIYFQPHTERKLTLFSLFLQKYLCHFETNTFSVSGDAAVTCCQW